MALFAELTQRGIISQVTDPELHSKLDQGGLTFYCGFDPTSDSLHLGSLFPLLTMRRLQMAGHRPLLLLGGATGMVGDPSGKSAERQLQPLETVKRNADGIRKVAEKFLAFTGPNAAKVVNNADWFQGISFIDFLRDVGKHFTVNHMLAKESVRARLEDREHGISYTEFSYMLLQAYDFLHLAEKEGCQLQIGGSDQWGNITAGVELIRRTRAHQAPSGGVAPHGPTYGLTTPLVTKSDGGKFGKTEAGTIWLSAERTTPYQFYQYLLQTPDSDVLNFLNFFSFRSLEEIAHLRHSLQAHPERREAQVALAQELTRLVHSQEELTRIEQASQALFSGDLKNLSPSELKQAFAEAPSSSLAADRLGGDGMTLVDLLTETQLCTSKGMARKDIQGGGIYLNQERMADPNRKVCTADLLPGSVLVLRKGKKTYHLVQVG